jgi:NDP-sugar pyrophosphorylase family protein
LKALILAGGKATRLHPLTLHMPKQLIMIDGRPVIHYIIDHCKKNGIRDFILCTSESLKADFKNALGHGEALGVNIQYSIKPDWLGTAGRIVSARHQIVGEDFLVYYGDIVTSFDLKPMIEFHKRLAEQKNCICTLAVSRDKVLEIGLVLSEEGGSHRITQFKEKPRVSEVSDFRVNAGIAACSSRIFSYCGLKDDLFHDVLPELISDDQLVSSYLIRGPFFDIGTFSSIEQIARKLRHRESRNQKAHSTKWHSNRSKLVLVPS